MADNQNRNDGLKADCTIMEHLKRDAPIKAYITDAVLYEQGELVGIWQPLPTTKEELQSTLREIREGGIDGDYFIDDYQTDIAGLFERLPEGADINELNYLAVKLAGMDEFELGKFATVIRSGRHCDSVMDIINVTENMDLFDVGISYTLEQYGELLAIMGKDEFAWASERLNNSSDHDMRDFAVYVERLEKYFDEKAYARDLVAKENGVFTKDGYLTESEGFKEVYTKITGIPPEHRVYVSPEQIPQERPSVPEHTERTATIPASITNTDEAANMFTDMSDWCLAKDYNGAERFNDGKRPLMAETEFADIIICGCGSPSKDAVSISVHPYGDEGFFEGEVATKELAEKIGADIINHINSHTDGLSMFGNRGFKDFFISLPITNIRTDEPLEETGNKGGMTEHKPTIRAFIVNVDEMANMFKDIERLRNGKYPGAWHDFPTTAEKIQATLKEIGVDGVNHTAYIVNNYDTDIPGLFNNLHTGMNIDELNYLAVKLAGMDEFELEKFGAALEYSVFRDGLTGIINTAENLDCFDLQPAFSAAEYGEFLADMEFDSFGLQIKALEESKNPADRELAAYIGLLEKHFNTEVYGHEKVQEESGRFTKQGYLTKVKALEEIYTGTNDIPPEYRVSAPPERKPQERPSVLDKLAAAKQAVARTDAEKPPADKSVAKSPDAEL